MMEKPGTDNARASGTKCCNPSPVNAIRRCGRAVKLKLKKTRDWNEEACHTGTRFLPLEDRHAAQTKKWDANGELLWFVRSYKDDGLNLRHRLMQGQRRPRHR